MSFLRSPQGRSEFIILMAMLISLIALSIDAILPALPQVGTEYGLADINDTQYMIGVLFAGMAIGQMFFGPLSDSTGRKPMIYLGLAVFMAGSALSLLAQSYELQLTGRFLQGLGASGPRVVTIAIVRDRFEGREMAKIMSFIMAVFIMVPAIAPAMGQGVMYLLDWRSIFSSFFILAAISFVWFALRQPETLTVEHRTRFSLRHLLQGCREVMSNRQAMIFTLAGGLTFGGFVTYLSTAPLLFRDLYGIVEGFPLYFAILSLAIGAASITNARLVMRFGMRALSTKAQLVITFVSCLALAVFMMLDGPPPLWGFMAYMMVVFFCFGMLFANFNALSMEPLGHVAGIAAALIGFLTTAMSVVIGGAIGQAHDGTAVPLTAGFAGLGLLSLAITRAGERREAAETHT